ncbi:MAG: cell division protein FtsQ/DivIB [Bacillota bacterium]
MAGSSRYIRRRKSRSNFLQSIFFVLIFLLAAYVLARSSFFEVREIRVSGNNFLSREKIIEASEINIGQNIFKLDLKASSQKVKIIPLVKNVEMHRRLPSTVEIVVAERSPLALLPSEAGFIQVDEEGVYLQKGDIAANQMPVITGVAYALPAPGEKIASGELDTALAVVKGLPGDLTERLSEINVTGGQVVLYTLEGIQCRLGLPDDLEQKGEVMLSILGGLKSKGKSIQYIDLSYAGSPVVKYAE